MITNNLLGGDKMQISDDKEQYLKYYMESIHFKGDLQINAIKTMVQYKGQGNEYISCSFDPDDEDYQDGFVTLYFWQPAVEQDTMVFIDNRSFYKYLVEVSKRYMEKEPQVKEELEKYLYQLRTELKI